MFFVKKGIFAQRGHLARLEEFHTDVSIFAPQINYPRFTEMHTDVSVYSDPVTYPRFTEMHTDVAIYAPLGYVSLGGEVVTLDGDLITFN